MKHFNQICVPQTNALNYLNSPCISILAGTSHKEEIKWDRVQKFCVHKDLISQRSDFIARMLNGTWEQSDDKTILLPNARPEVFELYVQILYTGVIPLVEDDDVRVQDSECLNRGRSKQEIKEDYEKESVADKKYVYNMLIDLYILSEELQDRQSKNIIIRAFAETISSTEAIGLGNIAFPPVSCVTRTYLFTKPGDNMRKLLVEYYARSGGYMWLKERDDYLVHDDAEFYYDLATRLMQTRVCEPRQIRAEDYLET